MFLALQLEVSMISMRKTSEISSNLQMSLIFGFELELQLLRLQHKSELSHSQRNSLKSMECGETSIKQSSTQWKILS